MSRFGDMSDTWPWVPWQPAAGGWRWFSWALLAEKDCDLTPLTLSQLLRTCFDPSRHPAAYCEQSL
eukprot:5231654-Amphidinium_carterae.1